MSLSKSVGAITSGVFMLGLGVCGRFVELPESKNKMAVDRTVDLVATFGTLMLAFGGILILLGVVGVVSAVNERRSAF